MSPDGKKVLVVEDEPKIAQLLSDYLQREGCRVDVLEEGTAVVEYITASPPDFVILDLMLPGKDGLTICREVRQFSSIPIMILTAKVDEIDRLVGLELGADDYVCKPFSPREVVARVKTIMRRVAQAPEVVADDSNTISYQGVTLDPDRYQCLADGELVELTPIEFRLLLALLSRPGHVFSRDRLMSMSYTDGRIVSDRTIDTHVKNLRKKLPPNSEGNELVHSIYGVGYKVE